jgi:hypothetical protein
MAGEMVDYTIAAIPTLYHGRQYRSRLEARWAAFFDLLDWEFEYEPFDLGLWSPDFLLTNWNVLVEVKPSTDLDKETWRRISAAGERSKAYGVLLTYTAAGLRGEADYTHIGVGWFGSGATNFRPHHSFLAWYIDREIMHKAEFAKAELTYVTDRRVRTASGYMLNLADRSERDAATRVPLQRAEHGHSLWARASNSVQYQPKPRQ